MAATIRTLKLNLLADTENFSKGLKHANNDSESFSKKIGSSMRAAAKGAAIAGAAVAGLAVAFGVDAVKAAIEDEKSQKMLANSLKNTTKATDKQIKSVEKWITKQQFALGVSDSKLRPAFDKLARVTGSVTKAQDLLTLGLDISAGTGKDLAAVTDILTRAQNGNLTGLKKLGVPLSDAIIKNKDLSTALDLTAQKFKGAAAANADTFSGKMKIFSERVGEAKEAIGTAILEAIQPLADKYLPKISEIVTNVAEGFAGTGKGKAGNSLGEAIRNTATAIGELFKALAPENTKKGEEFAGSLETIAGAVDTLAGAIRGIADALRGLKEIGGKFGEGWKGITDAIGPLATFLGDVYKFQNGNNPEKRKIGGGFKNSPVGRWLENFTSGFTGLGGARAMGGPVQSGRTYLVGERGPEFVTMGGSGFVTPNNKMGGTTIINLNGIVDAESARRAIENILKSSSVRTGAVSVNGSRI
jgi:hypothetical protein